MDNGVALVCSVMIIVGLPGVIFHVTLIVLKFRLKSMSHPFFIILTSMAVADISSLGTFLLWCVPVTILKIPAGSDYYMNHVPAFIMTVSFDAGIYSALGISINRFSAIYFPTRYEMIFSVRNVTFLVLAVWVLSVAQAFLFLIPQCTEYYDYKMFSMATDLSGNNTCIYGDYLFVAYWLPTMTFTNLVINWATFYKLVRQRKMGGLTDEQKLRRRKEITFFIQATVIGFVYVLGSLLIIFAYSVAADRFGFFFVSTFSFMLQSTTNGFVFLVANPETREASFGRISKLLGCEKSSQIQG